MSTPLAGAINFSSNFRPFTRLLIGHGKLRAAKTRLDFQAAERTGFPPMHLKKYPALTQIRLVSHICDRPLP
jgi:hypothetical protein